MMTENQQGTSKGWKSLILSVLVSSLDVMYHTELMTHQDSRGEKVSLLLHPALPPLMRPNPPLSALHHFGPENKEEKRLRLELGIGKVEDATCEDEEDGVDVENAGAEIMAPYTTNWREQRVPLASAVTGHHITSGRSTALADRADHHELDSSSSVNRIVETGTSSGLVKPTSHSALSEPAIASGLEGSSAAVIGVDTMDIDIGPSTRDAIYLHPGSIIGQRYRNRD